MVVSSMLWVDVVSSSIHAMHVMFPQSDGTELHRLHCHILLQGLESAVATIFLDLRLEVFNEVKFAV